MSGTSRGKECLSRQAGNRLIVFAILWQMEQMVLMCPQKVKRFGAEWAPVRTSAPCSVSHLTSNPYPGKCMSGWSFPVSLDGCPVTVCSWRRRIVSHWQGRTVCSKWHVHWAAAYSLLWFSTIWGNECKRKPCDVHHWTVFLYGSLCVFSVYLVFSPSSYLVSTIAILFHLRSRMYFSKMCLFFGSLVVPDLKPTASLFYD